MLLVAAVLLSRFLWRRRLVTIGAVLLAGLGVFQLIPPRANTPSVGSPQPAPRATSSGVVSLPRYSVTDLGTLGGKSSTAHGLNNAGQVVGSSATPVFLRAFLWTSGRMRDLGGLEDGGSQAVAVNEAGQVVGDSRGRAFLWEDGAIRNLTTAPTVRSSYATHINDCGQVVGGVVIGDDMARAFLWERGKLRLLGTLPGGRYSLGRAINNDGQVVGWGHNGEYWNNFHIPRAFLWDEQQGMREIGTLGGSKSYDNSFAYDINNLGQVVGVSNQRAFLWQDGKMKDLGTLPGYTRGRASAINDRGQVVGGASDPYRSTPVLWQGGKIHDLNQLIPPDSGWVLGGAADINSSGQIVGVGHHHGVARAYLLTPRPFQQAVRHPPVDQMPAR